MVKCEMCYQDINEVRTCKLEPIVSDGVSYLPVKYGDETGVWEGTADESPYCPDCGVTNGGYHHLGCGVERCPVCKGQLTRCDCIDM